MYRKSVKNQEINIITKETNEVQMRKKKTNNKKPVTLKLRQISIEAIAKYDTQNQKKKHTSKT